MKPDFVSKDQLDIGPTLRHFRKKNGYNLTTLAEKSGLSASFISLAERGKAIPSIVSLMNLANALGISIDNFLEVPQGAQAIRRKSQPQKIRMESPVDYIRLSGGLPGQQLDAMLITIPVAFHCPKVRRDGESFYYILDGAVNVQIDKESYVLEPGDSVHFSTRHQYVITCGNEGPATLLWVGTPALFQSGPSDKTEG